MSAILNYFNVHNFLIFQPILMILVSKLKVYKALSDKTYSLLGLRSPLNQTKESELTNLSGSGIIIPLKKEFVEKICTCRGSKSPEMRVQ